jgi:hypothetical protein
MSLFRFVSYMLLKPLYISVIRDRFRGQGVAMLNFHVYENRWLEYLTGKFY